MNRNVIDGIFCMLNDDMVSHGFLKQYLMEFALEDEDENEVVKRALRIILNSGKVEIGNARIKTPNYVEFVAWKGSVLEKIDRAMHAVFTANEMDRDFSYWICLKENVDRFE